MKTIDKIQEIRSKNNGNWMDLLRLALRLDPVETKKILKNIIKHDKEITETIQELLDD